MRADEKARPSVLGAGYRTALLLAGAALMAGCRDHSLPAAAPPASAAPASGQPGAPPAPHSATANSFYADRFSRRATVAEMTELGRKLFFERQLSASGQMSCATCHDPAFAYGPPNDRATQLGGPDMKSAGLRAVPSLRYLQSVPRFEEHHFDEAVEDSTDQGPTGGHAWDGRADTTHDQARLPLTSPLEMANATVEAVTSRIEEGPLAAQFRAVFGDDVFADPTRAVTALLKCLELFQQSPADFYPYSSRYDAYLRGKGTLTPAEQRGLALFNDPKKGNCASCHPSQIRKGAFPQFTDFGFNAIGVPRNRALPANRDPGYFDRGLCGPLRRDLAGHPEYCGFFRVPVLRNTATRRAYFHNGVFHTLEQVMDFYVARDVSPDRFYPKVQGRVEAFDDLPPEQRRNVTHDPPFDRKSGAAPALTKAEIRDVIAFLKALTDADAKRK
jgi:cytochrome c peroxidase